MELLNLNQAYRSIFHREKLKTMGMKKKKEKLLYVLCQNSLFDDTYITSDELVVVLEISSTLIREMIKELDEEGFIKKTKYGKKIGYSANLASIDEFQN